MTHLTDATWDREVNASPLPVLVMFSATWCQPCKAMGSTLDQMGAAWAGKVRVAKADVEQAPDAANRAGVTSVPTFVVYRDGVALATHRGATTARGLVDLVRGAGVVL